MIALDQMGIDMAWRLFWAGHQCVVYDREPKATGVPIRERAIGARLLVDPEHTRAKMRTGDAQRPGAERGDST
jgi:6-phosphogluconate dehydrogenase (decarboxylating)